MADKNKDKKLNNMFKEFPPVSRSEWESQILKDLSGVDYKKELRWNPPEDLSLLPFYMRDDLDSVSHVSGKTPDEYPFIHIRPKNSWDITEDVTAADISETNILARKAIKGGVDTLLFHIDADPHEGLLGGDLRGVPLQSQADMQHLLDEIDVRSTGFFFDTGVLSPLYMAMFINELERQGIKPTESHVLFQYNPFTRGAARGRWSHSHEQMDHIIATLARSPFRSLNMDGTFYYRCGATIVQELGIALAIGSEYLAAASERGLPVDEIAGSVFMTLSAGPLYLPEIAKFRAARLLWDKVVAAYDPDATRGKSLFIHAETTPWNKSIRDPHNNMIRVTTEAMAAIIGGADSVRALPYDAQFREPDTFSRRISRNVHHILKHESHLDKVANPADGSYYLEVLTDQIAKKAWDFFKFIEKQGGFRKALENRFLQLALEDSIAQKQKAISAKELVFVGVNKYIDPQETGKPPLMRTRPIHSIRQSNYNCPKLPELNKLATAFREGALLGDAMDSVLQARKQLYPAMQPWRAPEIFEHPGQI